MLSVKTVGSFLCTLEIFSTAYISRQTFPGRLIQLESVNENFLIVNMSYRVWGRMTDCFVGQGRDVPSSFSSAVSSLNPGLFRSYLHQVRYIGLLVRPARLGQEIGSPDFSDHGSCRKPLPANKKHCRFVPVAFPS